LLATWFAIAIVAFATCTAYIRRLTLAPAPDGGPQCSV
jgi:hypothetical protein